MVASCCSWRWLPVIAMTCIVRQGNVASDVVLTGMRSARFESLDESPHGGLPYGERSRAQVKCTLAGHLFPVSRKFHRGQCSFHVEEFCMANLMTETEVARQLNVSLALLRRWRVKKHGPAFVKVGVLVRYRPEDLDAWLNELPTGGAKQNAGK